MLAGDIDRQSLAEVCRRVWVRRKIRLTVRRRSQCAAIKLWLVNEVSDTPGKVARPIIKTTKAGKVSVGGNVAVAAVNGIAIVPLGINNNIGLVVTDTAEHVS